MNDIVDSFGSNVHIMAQTEEEIEVGVRVSEEAMLRWAVQYADSVEVMFPKKLRARIGETLRQAAERYK